MAALIDPTVKGRYPVVLGEGMLGRTSNDIFTSIRYNHKPTLSSPDALSNARLKPSQQGATTSYDLSYTDGGSSYAYTGTRSVDDNQYVLHFDPDRKVFVLDKVDSTFNMNITRLPGNSDPAKLARQYPHLESYEPEAEKTPLDAPKPKTAIEEPKPKPKPASKPPAKSAALRSKQPRRKMEKKKPLPQKDVALSLPKPESPKQEKKSAKRAPKDEDDEDDEGDGDLLIEYPGGNNATAKVNDFSPAFPAFPQPRRFDDFMDQRDSEGDADGESDDDLDNDFKLPSPVNHNNQAAQVATDINADDAAACDDAAVADDEPESAAGDMEADLAKEMEIAFEVLANSQEGSPDGGDESEISEED